jgi:cyanuric acid amidohydrolase
MTMRTTSFDVIQIPTKGPGDVSGLLQLIEAGIGGVNDFTRKYAVSALSVALAPYVALPAHDVEQKIAFVMSGGTEGVLSPHITVFARMAITNGSSDGAIAGKRLSIGIAHPRNFMPEELGCSAQIEETARAVRVAMMDAGIDDPQDVHFVQIKCPLLTSDRIEGPMPGGTRQ